MALVPFLPPPGINSDDTTFSAEGQWADGTGFRFVQGKPETINGPVVMSSATAVNRANKMLVFELSGTINLAVAGDALRIGAINAVGSDITPASGWTADRRHSLAMFGDVLLALVAGGGLFESSAGAQAVAVTNAPNQSTVMLVTPSRQVMLLGTKEEVSGTFNGRCIRWSDIENRTTWAATATNNAGEYILPGQEDIVGGCVLGDYILIWTEGSLWLAQFVGDPAQTFIFERVTDIGICGQDAFALYRQTVYWMSPDFGFYSYQLGGVAQKLPCPNERSFRAGHAGDHLGRFFACANSAYGEIWFCIGTRLDAAAAIYFVFCVDESVRAQRPVWYYGAFSHALSANASAMVESPLPWDASGSNITQTIAHAYSTSGEGQPWRWDTAATATGMPNSYIQTGGFYLDESQRRMMIRRFIPDFDAQGGTVSLTLFLRDRPMSAAVTKGPYSILITDTKEDLRASGKIAVAKFSIASAIRVRFGKPLFDVVTLGER